MHFTSFSQRTDFGHSKSASGPLHEGRRAPPARSIRVIRKRSGRLFLLLIEVQISSFSCIDSYLKKNFRWVSEVAQRTKALANKPNILSSILEPTW